MGVGEFWVLGFGLGGHFGELAPFDWSLPHSTTLRAGSERSRMGSEPALSESRMGQALSLRRRQAGSESNGLDVRLRLEVGVN